MIDTDKYKGHTEGPWKWNAEDVLLCVSDNVPLVTFDDTDPSSPVFYMDIQTANLIADAPLLLAEVERLREIEREWKQMWSKLEDYPDMCAELICFMESEEE